MSWEPERWERVKALFGTAAELPEAEWTAFLDRACPDDGAIRQEVLRLLGFGARQNAFIDNIPVLPGLLTEAAEGPRSCAPGELLAERFRIIRLVGSGGMGEVYEAFDELLNQTIALKTIRPEIVGEPQMEERFRREVLLARQVTHPNVCRVFDYVRTEKLGFLTMEFLDGETLAHFLRRQKRLKLDEARPLIDQMVAALTAAHRAGVVHRDFKGANVFLTTERDGGTRVVVTDFGLARSTSLPGDETATGMGAGTPAFMAPEQLEGRPVGPAADIYALGLVMYEMATGSPPYPGDSPLQVAVRRLREKPKRPRAVAPDVDSKWESVILRCLEYEPEDRFPEASGVMKSLASRYSLPWFRIKKSWRIGTVAVVAVLSVAVGLVGGRWLGAEGPAPAAANYYAMGVAALADGTYARATRMLELAAEKDSTYAPIRLRLAEAYWRLDQPRQAQEQLLRAEQQGTWGNLDRRRLYDGTRAMVLRDFNTAEATLAARIGSPFAPAAPQPRLDLARAQDSAEHIAAAEATYLQVLAEQPGQPAALLRLAGLADQQLQPGRAAGYYDQAEAAYRRGLNDEGLALTLIQRAMGQQYVSATKAKALLAKAEAISPTALTEGMRARLLLTRAVIEVMNADFDRAESLAKDGVAMARAAGLEGPAAAALVDLGLAYLVKAQMPEAERHYREAEGSAKQAGSIYWQKRARLGLAWAAALSSGRKAEALAGLDEVEPFFTANRYRMHVLECTRIRADVLYSAQDLAGALALYKRTAEGAQEVGYERVRRRARQFQGELLMRLGRFPEAVRVLRATLAEYEREGKEKEFPVHYFQCRVALGNGLGFQGRMQESREVLEGLVADPELKSAAIRTQGLIAWSATEGELGRQEAANQLLERATAEAAADGAQRDEVRQQLCLRLASQPERSAEAIQVCLAVKAEMIAAKSTSFLAPVQYGLGQAYLDAGQRAKAMPELDEALDAYEKHQSRNNVFYVQLLRAAAGAANAPAIQEAWRKLTGDWTTEEKRQYLSRGPIARRVVAARVNLQ